MVWLYILTAVPLALFIILLLAFDSFSLTRWPTLLLTIATGMVMFLVSWAICRIPAIGGNRLLVSIVEELCKGVIVYILIARRKVGLLADATIYGSAIGAGFGLLANIFELTELYAEGAVDVWHTIFLGCEAAVMHIGCTSLLAMVLIMVHQGKYGATQKAKVIGTVVAFLATIVVHYVHALEPIDPRILTLLLIIYFVVSKHSLFKKNKKFVHEWLDAGINNEISLLGALKRGEFSTTRAGEYLLSLKERFDSETFFDMYCYVENYLELSIAARSNLILKEAGMDPVRDAFNSSRIAEMAALKKRIGPTAEIALRPIVDRNQVNDWAMNNLV
ncbi:MAG: PrsW family intramembrane metalloprotease [Bacteroidales bacterium]|nr:PrsW family intramembrane metalloprotease [Bacteroidales bacterium]